MRWFGLVVSILCLFLANSCSTVNDSSLTDEIGIDRGIMVLLGDISGEQAIRFADESDFLIYVQMETENQVPSVRRLVNEAGYYGKRIWVEKGTPGHISLGSNLADVILTAEDQEVRVSDTEIERVLCPGGIALINGQRITKPFPDGIDDWSHPYHGPDNNPQSVDQLAKAPYLDPVFS